MSSAARLPRLVAGIVLALAVAAPPAAAGDPPSLPPGLGGGGDAEEAREEHDDWDAQPPAESALRWSTDGFVEGRVGVRTRDDDLDAASIGELRASGGVEAAVDRVRARVAGDLLYDGVADDRGEIDLETGDGFLDLREAWVVARATDFLDVKVGRQILTWGTGDLLFVNDLFPKDWVSFFVGRDTEYLKAPSDAAKLSLFSGVANLDLVYTPRFDADRYLDGTRISFYDPTQGRIAGRDDPIPAEVPDRWFEDDEIAARLYSTVEGVELALYGYKGYWKSPAGQDPATGAVTFPRLWVVGASARSTLGPGLASGEVGYYGSEDDTDGTDPFVRNSEMRALVGYEQEIAHELTMGVQYYLEWRMDQDADLASLPPGASRPDEVRHVVTLRLTQQLLQQTLVLGLFAYLSPNELDTFLRPRATYRIDDHWSVEGGANLFYGKDVDTFFGQFQRSSNVFAAVRYGF